MSICDLCGEKSGWFQSRHPACGSRLDEAKKDVQAIVLAGAIDGKDYSRFEAEATQLAIERKVPFESIRESLLQGANDAATQIALQRPATEDDLNRVVGILQGFGIAAFSGQSVQRRWFGFASIGMSHTLWQVLNDVEPYYDGIGRMQFNLHAGESPVFSTGSATYAEERTVSTRGTGFQGLSVPVGAGVYYHLGGSQRTQEQASGLLPLDTGEILISNRAVYFGGQKSTFRIPLDSVLRYQHYVDAFGICQSHGAPKVFIPNFSGMDTGWFFYNLLSALTNKLIN